MGYGLEPSLIVIVTLISNIINNSNHITPNTDTPTEVPHTSKYHLTPLDNTAVSSSLCNNTIWSTKHFNVLYTIILLWCPTISSLSEFYELECDYNLHKVSLKNRIQHIKCKMRNLSILQFTVRIKLLWL